MGMQISNGVLCAVVLGEVVLGVSTRCDAWMQDWVQDKSQL